MKFNYIGLFQRNKYISKRDVLSLEDVIKNIETTTTCEIRLVIETNKPIFGYNPRNKAIWWFNKLKINNTVNHNGAMIYVNLAGRAVEVLIDSGVELADYSVELNKLLNNEVLNDFKNKQIKIGAEKLLMFIGNLLSRKYPKTPDDVENELPNYVVVV